MTPAQSLVDLLDQSSQLHPEKVVVAVPRGERLTYSRLASLSDEVCQRLRTLGVAHGDRVGLRLHKSIAGVALILGILKARATYVPVDADAPAQRAAYIFNNCGVRVLVTELSLKAALDSQLAALGARPHTITLADGGSSSSLVAALNSAPLSQPIDREIIGKPQHSDIAYILYTSGSTGNPKGVVLSHGNALSFVEWCTRTFNPNPRDIFSSHAPFHFDLSIFDIFVSIKHAATLVLIDEATGKEPLRLAPIISSEKITIWYSTPLILGLLARYGKMQRYDFAHLRIVMFAGEVFPIPQYQALRNLWRAPRYFNLYGPTETNVCTWYEIPSDEEVKRIATFPLGRMCDPNRGAVIDDQGHPVSAGTAGELIVSGPNVMQKYWDLPAQNELAFMVDTSGNRWYRTGDIVREEADVGYLYVGRRDRMVKRRGFRVELGEIEAALLREGTIQELGVVAIVDNDAGVRVTAFVSGEQSRSFRLTDFKALSMRCLPSYMMPDSFVYLEAMPHTSTGKIDYEELRRLAVKGELTPQDRSP